MALNYGAVLASPI